MGWTQTDMGRWDGFKLLSSFPSWQSFSVREWWPSCQLDAAAKQKMIERRSLIGCVCVWGGYYGRSPGAPSPPFTPVVLLSP